jgi:hypothetical protein
MVDELLEKFRNILTEIDTACGRLSLFALVKMDDLTSSWTLLVSQPNVTDESRRHMFREIAQRLTRDLTPNEISEVARVGVFPLNEHIIADLLKYKEGHIEKSFPANGNTIHEAYILRSETPANEEETPQAL